MDGVGSGFVGYSIPGVPSLRYVLSNSTCHVNPPGVYHTGARFSMNICRDYHSAGYDIPGMPCPAIHISVPGETPGYTIPTVPYTHQCVYEPVTCGDGYDFSSNLCDRDGMDILFSATLYTRVVVVMITMGLNSTIQTQLWFH